RPQEAFEASAPEDSVVAVASPGEPAPPESPSRLAAPLPELPPRKSVTYQPVPFSWKVGAVTMRLNAGFWHCGQSVRGASENFCRTSFSNPQSSQRYA